MSKVLITIEIEDPDKSGKRKVLISAAPRGEMPIVVRGAFAERHRLIDAVWHALLVRKPQMVTVKPEKAGPASDRQESAPADTAGRAAPDEPPTPPAALPQIEGDSAPPTQLGLIETAPAEAMPPDAHLEMAFEDRVSGADVD